MEKRFLRRTGAILVCTAVVLSTSFCGTGVAAADAATAGSNTATYNYATVLRDSIIFYDANKCGKDAGVDNFFDWRDACHTEDGADVGYDLTGGYHDCGDHVKFGITQGYAASVLEWTYYRYKNALDKTGNTAKMLQQLKHFTDYFLKCHTDADTFYYQVGDGTVDHTYWGSPSDQTNDRPAMFKADASHPAADVLGETSAALALMYLNYKSIDADYAQQCLKTAKELYQMGKSNPGLSNAQGFYSSSTYKDDMAWAATWLNIITGDKTYLSDAENYVTNPNNGLPLSDKWTMCWDDMHLPAEIQLYELTGKAVYKQALSENIDFWEHSCKTTSGGLKYLTGWGVLRYSAAESMIALAYYEDTGDTTAKDLAVSQINYILGSNPENISYVIGFGNKWPLHPHHRAANGYTYLDNGNLKAAKHLLLGALIGGPDSDDTFTDDGSQYQFTETGIDYAAGLVGACAGLSNIYNESNAQDSEMGAASCKFDIGNPADVTIPVKFNGNTLDNVVNDGEQLVKGTDYTVSDDSVTISKAYLAKQGEGELKLTFLFSEGKIPSVVFDITNSGSEGGTTTSSNLEIQEFNGTTAASVNGISPRIRIINKGKKAISLADVKVRYFYTEDGSQSQNFYCDWSTVGSGNVTGTFAKLSTPASGADSYLEISFTSAAGNLAQGGYIDISARFSKSDWSNYTQTNDYSYNPTGSDFADWTKMAGYVGSSLAWGSEPGGSVTPVNNSSISPVASSFDKNTSKQSDIAVALNLNGNTLSGIYYGDTKLAENTDYTVSGSTVTILKSFLAQQPTGTTTLAFKFSAGSDAALDIAVTDSTTPDKPVTSGNLKVEMFNGSTSATLNGIAPRFRITNTGSSSISLSTVKLRYYYTSDGTQPQSFWCDWSPVGSGNVTGTFGKVSASASGADSYLEIGFTNAAGSLAPGASIEVQVRFAKNDWSNYTQTGDYSFNAQSSSYTEWNKVTAYQNGSLVWGTEP